VRPSLQALRRSRRPTPAAIERFVAGQEFPIVDERGATFVYRGSAEAVHLRTWVYGLPSSIPFERLGKTDLWHLWLELPEGSRIEYKLEIVERGGSHWITDPLNPLRARDPYGANSVCRAHGYRRPHWTIAHRNVPCGTFDEIALPVVDGSPSTLRVYVPARFRRTRRYPLLVVHDGSDFVEYGGLAAALDNLMDALEIPSAVVALHDPGERVVEYTASAEHVRVLGQVMLPAVQKAFPLIDAPAARGLLGASLGAVAALHAAWSDPGRWGRLMLLSGSFAFSDIGPHERDALFDPVVRFVNAMRRDPGGLAEASYVSCGRYESLINENRALVSLLQGHGIAVRYREVPDGHHWENWRDRLRDGLGWLFPGPSWMVY
jgi:enterochelin esterase family protein